MSLDLSYLNPKPAAKPMSTWKGSTRTAAMVREAIAQRFGDVAAKNYKPLENCFTYRTWLAKGYQVKKGEKAINSQTMIPSKETNENGQPLRMYRKPVALFYASQVEKINK